MARLSTDLAGEQNGKTRHPSRVLFSLLNDIDYQKHCSSCKAPHRPAFIPGKILCEASSEHENTTGLSQCQSEDNQLHSFFASNCGLSRPFRKSGQCEVSVNYRAR